ncbi:hypothetical protein J2Y83_003728 [Pseudomonas marginalis]|uniref:hypothetical protein n=1 Tax=Pseudomonas marginalis TaxID=298 RepID=UPI0020A0E630|nr:hypothetical protein [Pseudomonas marginalis]MCP1507755.1 hypothetical protein [Pseudomonas marginalis]MCP1525259.1 hypothetical protein [Pseudomonas marginalis]MDQ0500146.1 hypothetical protein [Pseudomonas marginalis]
MHKVLIALVIGVSSQASFAAGSVTYLSCPSLDKRADDLLVIVDQPSGTASLQSNKSGSGLNFTSPASFGPKEVTWRSESKSFQQKFSVDRVNLTLKRETTSGMTGSIYVETSPCSIVKAPSNTKF